MRWGIRSRITATATIAVAVVLVVTSIALTLVQRRLLTDDLDESLATHSAAVENAIARGTVDGPLAGQGDDDAIAQVVRDDGTVIAASANLVGASALPALDDRDGEQIRSMRLPADDAEYRVLSRRVESVTIHTGATIDDIDESVTALRLGLAVTIPVVALTLALLVWWLVGRTLRPVDAIRREVADISGRNLGRRVPEPATGDEIAELAHTMNAMLERVERAADQQQRFVADASHELRSPLARMRAELEVDLGHPSTADTPATHRSVLAETEHLQRLVEDLLLLARVDANGAATASVRDVDLDDIVMRETRRVRETTAVTVDVRGVSAAQVQGNPDELTRVIRNLLDNAARHARTAITVVLVEDDSQATITVADDGPGVPSTDEERIFERFVRLDEARSNRDGGSGLGLAIARELVERHGGTIRLDVAHSPGARFVVRLPTRRPA